MQIKTTAELTVTLNLKLTESEAAALDAIAGYGAKSFLEVFYKHLGKAYLQPHEAGLRKLFDSIGGLQYGLNQAKKARQVFHGQLIATKPIIKELLK